LEEEAQQHWTQQEQHEAEAEHVQAPEEAGPCVQADRSLQEGEGGLWQALNHHHHHHPVAGLDQDAPDPTFYKPHP